MRNRRHIVKRFRSFVQIEHSAFTLVELMLVLVILSMTTTLVAVRYSSFLRAQRVKSTAEQCRSIDQFARKLSALESLDLAISQDPSGTSFRLEASGGLVRNWHFSRPVSVLLQDANNSSIDSVRYRQSEGTADYSFRVVEGNTILTLSVAGGTGEVAIR